MLLDVIFLAIFFLSWQVVFLGMGISSPLIGLVGDKYGRKVVSPFCYSALTSFGSDRKPTSLVSTQAKQITHARQRSCSPRQKSVHYENIKHPACTVDWVARLCCCWLSREKATQFSHGKIYGKIKLKGKEHTETCYSQRNLHSHGCQMGSPVSCLKGLTSSRCGSCS